MKNTSPCSDVVYIALKKSWVRLCIYSTNRPKQPTNEEQHTMWHIALRYILYSNEWPSQTWPPKVVVAAAALAGLADLTATIQMSHLCGVKQLFQSFFGFFLFLSFLHVRVYPEQVRQQLQQKIVFFFPLEFFLQGVFCWDHGASVLSIPPPYCAYFSSDEVQLHQEPLLLLQHL